MKAIVTAVLLLPIGLWAASFQSFPVVDGRDSTFAGLEVSHAIAPATDLERNWSQAQVSEAEIRWNFSPRPRCSSDELILNINQSQPFGTLFVEVENLGPACEFGVYLEDSRRTLWYTDGVRLAANKLQTVTLPWHKWYASSRTPIPRASMAFPIRRLYLAADGLQSKTEYALAFRKVLFCVNRLDVQKLDGWQFPATVTGNDNVPLPDLTVVSGENFVPESASVVLKKDAFVAGQADYQFAPESGNCVFTLRPAREIHISAVAPAGKYQIHFLLTGKSSDGQKELTFTRTLGEVAVQTHAPFRSPTVAEVKPYKGVPTLMINGIPHSGMTHATYCPRPLLYHNFAAVGVDLFSICGTPTDSAYGLSPNAWVAEDEYDYSTMDERFALILAENPQALMFPRIHLHAPRWWLDAHPDDVVMGEAKDGTQYVYEHCHAKPAPSWASPAWREATVRGLRKMIEHIESMPYANNIIGYHLASGTTEEWMMWGGETNEWTDCSPVNQAYFRKWLQKKYGDVAKLRAAWHDDAVTFETARIPSRKQWESAKLDHYQDPAVAQNVIDFNLYNSWMVADTINVFCSVIKEATGRKKVVGAFYGYLLQLCGAMRQVLGGHNAVRMILESPDIDFLASPTSYTFRQEGGEGTSHFMSMTESLKLHNKLWFNENDIRTSVTTTEQLGRYGRPATVDGDINQQNKEIANVITTGVAQWWFDVGYIRHDHPRLLSAMGNLHRAARWASRLDRSTVSETAFVIDEDSIAYLRAGDWLGSELFLHQLPQLQRSGMAVGHYLASDLDKLANQKLIVISYAVAPDAEVRQKVDNLKNNHRVILFMRDAGLFKDGSYSAKWAEELTGIKLKIEPEAMVESAVFEETDALDDAPSPTANLAGVEVEDPPQRIDSFTLMPDDPEAEVLARNAKGEPLIVMKRFPEWTAVYSAFAMPPAQFFRNLGTLAGVHHYIDTPDVVWANHSMIAVCVNQPGVRTIHLPRLAKVSEMYSNKVIADTPVDTIEVDFPAKSTMIFTLE